MISIVNKTYKHYSPLRYPGGKSCLSDFLITVIEHNNLTGCTYIEPYAGGAGAALTLLMLEKVEKIIINDYDKAIYYMWDAILNNTNRFIRKIKSVEVSIDEWKNQKQIYQTTRSKFNKGFAAFYLNRTNRSGIIGGGPIGGIAQTSNWTIDARFNKKNLIERIEKIALYKNRIEVTNLDGAELVSLYKNKENTFIYLDPPYYVKGSCLYLNHFQSDNHKNLSNILNKNNRTNWIMTYDNVQEISNLYPERTQYSFSINYSADKAKIGKELLILSDSITIPLTYL